MKRYPGTLFLLISSIIFQCLITIAPGAMNVLAFSPHNGLLGIFGLVTYQVSHANWPHLIGNFITGLPFMLYLEKRLGKDRFLKYYFLCGVFSALFQCILGDSSGLIGSSGSIFGCVGGACLLFGDSLLEFTFSLAFILLLLLPQLAVAPYSFLTGIANYGHIGGMIGGFLLSARILRKK